MTQRCSKCGSYALNLDRQGIDQGGLCDVHYWQGKYGALKESHIDLLGVVQEVLEHNQSTGPTHIPVYIPASLRDKLTAVALKGFFL